MVRREMLASGVLAAALLAAPAAEACSLTGERRVRFSDADCRESLERWVALLNDGPRLTLEAIEERAAEVLRNVEIEDEMIEAAVGERTGDMTDRTHLFYKQFLVSDDRLDARPVRIHDVNLFRRLRNRASYQFTLERYSYHAADPEGCNGLFTHDEYWGVERTSYVGAFHNNRLQSVRLFPEWYLEEVRA
ncbi:MAG TPA: hypothetical protein VEA61_15720 [Allosphingosinicella sp.]|nr:hypothetical protein [Allosphingosinicella sp.]